MVVYVIVMTFIVIQHSLGSFLLVFTSFFVVRRGCCFIINHFSMTPLWVMVFFFIRYLGVSILG